MVIVNYFYWKQAARLESDAVIEAVTRRVTEWLLNTGRCNLLVDVMNEAGPGWKLPAFHPERIDRLIEIVQQTSLGGRRLLAGASTGGGDVSACRTF